MKRRTTDAFTLVELLIVMVIIGILLGISVAGFVTYRSNTALQSSLNDFTTTLRSVKNTAQNNSVYKDAANNLIWTYYYGFEVSGTKLKPFYCLDSQGKSVPDETTKANIRSNINTYLSNCTFQTSSNKEIKGVTIDSTNCNVILFETVTGRMYTSSRTDCSIKFSTGNQSKRIKFVDNSLGDYSVV